MKHHTILHLQEGDTRNEESKTAPDEATRVASNYRFRLFEQNSSQQNDRLSIKSIGKRLVGFNRMNDRYEMKDKAQRIKDGRREAVYFAIFMVFFTLYASSGLGDPVKSIFLIFMSLNLICRLRHMN